MQHALRNVRIIPELRSSINFEGFGFSLIEAMALGCVPVASKISGVTDWIVRHNETGRLCGIGRTTEFADAIECLARNRELLQRMSHQAAREAQERFSLEHTNF